MTQCVICGDIYAQVFFYRDRIPNLCNRKLSFRGSVFHRHPRTTHVNKFYDPSCPFVKWVIRVVVSQGSRKVSVWMDKEPELKVRAVQ